MRPDYSQHVNLYLIMLRVSTLGAQRLGLRGL